MGPAVVERQPWEEAEVILLLELPQSPQTSLFLHYFPCSLVV